MELCIAIVTTPLFMLLSPLNHLHLVLMQPKISVITIR
ncbi:hypothetical protein M573_129027 [Prevotella intermedia ZT]|uniref:Uncharacterized protein n=1 Tax=Prevotella intermedia ZT TaxID=1347790 RepID=A0AAP0V1F6_PREIN|nr:hypothetical protein M573_129027 [Prevotella intermedia ZT]